MLPAARSKQLELRGLTIPELLEDGVMWMISHRCKTLTPPYCGNFDEQYEDVCCLDEKGRMVGHLDKVYSLPKQSLNSKPNIPRQNRDS